MKKIILFLILIMLFSSFSFAENPINDSNKLTIYFFWGDGCPHCTTQKPVLEELGQKYPQIEIKMFETWNNQKNQEFFSKVANDYGITPRGVPTTFIGEKYWIGYNDNVGKEIEEYVKFCTENNCTNQFNDEEKIEIDINTPQDENPTKEICVHAFIDNDCGECNQTKEFIDTLKLTNVNIIYHNINDQNELELYKKFKNIYGLTTAGYPIIFLGDNYLIGLNSIKNNFENIINECQTKNCPCPAEKIDGLTPSMPNQDFKPEKTEIIEIPFVGEINIGEMPLFFMTALIAFVDGFNPCSLWVLTFLLGIVIYSGSRKKIFLVGITFLLVTAAAYGAFMLGLLNVFSYVGYTPLIKIGVALIATIFAIVNIKDYFWYKKGISFTISDKYKPKIFKDIRNIMDPKKSMASMLLATVIMSLGIVLVELPCTAGFPMIWTNILTQNQVSGMLFWALFLLYMTIYLIDELVVFTGVVLTLKASKFEEKQGRTLKLIGGMIMLALAITLVFAYELMNSLMGSIYVFGSALIVSYLIIIIHKKILPKFGIQIGSETNNEIKKDEKNDDQNKNEIKKNKKILVKKKLKKVIKNE